VLAVVAWNMAEKHEFATLIRASRGDAVVLTVTFLLVVFRDLTEGILVGFGLGVLLFLHRMAQAVEVERGLPLVEEDVADTTNGGRAPYDPTLATDSDIVVHRISGALFFGAAATVGAALDRIAGHPRTYVIDLSAVPMLDSTAAATLQGFERKVSQRGARLYFTGARSAVRRVLIMHGLRKKGVRFFTDIDAAVAAARGRVSDDVRGETLPASD
jgi:SulP family sulfate permease